MNAVLPVAVEDTRVSIHVLGCTHALVTLHCSLCTELVDVVHGKYGEDFSISRVNGDSQYGYEPMHTICGIKITDPQAVRYGNCGRCGAMCATLHIDGLQWVCC